MIAAACGSEDEPPVTAQAPVSTSTTQPQSVVTTEASPDEPAEDPEEEADFGKSVTLNLAHPFPANHPIQAEALEPWASEVKRVTQGTVQIEFFAGGALGPAPQTYENAVSGAVDIGWALQGYTPGRFPVTDVIEMPFIFSSARQATDVLWALHEEFESLRNEYSDVKLLGMWVHDVGDMWLTGARVDKITDLEGLSIRAPSPIQNAVIAALGANPVGLPAPDLYDALERGVIDGLFIANSGVASFNLFDVISSGVQCNCYVAAQFLAMNLDRWNDLSVAQRSAIEEVSGRVLSETAAAVYDSASDSAVRRLTESGIVKVRLDDEEFGRWRQAARSVVEGWIVENAGSFPSREIYERMLRLLGF
jgi:TRAP-type C4-dicarboxylate transport system substrate-binding protein